MRYDVKTVRDPKEIADKPPRLFPGVDPGIYSIRRGGSASLLSGIPHVRRVRLDIYFDKKKKINNRLPTDVYVVKTVSLRRISLY